MAEPLHKNCTDSSRCTLTARLLFTAQIFCPLALKYVLIYEENHRNSACGFLAQKGNHERPSETSKIWFKPMSSSQFLAMEDAKKVEATTHHCNLRVGFLKTFHASSGIESRSHSCKGRRSLEQFLPQRFASPTNAASGVRLSRRVVSIGKPTRVASYWRPPRASPLAQPRQPFCPTSG